MALDEHGKAFLTWLEDHRGAKVCNELGALLPQVILGVQSTAGAGKLVMELRFALEKDSEDEVIVGDKVTPTIPESRRDVYFIDANGELVRVRPRRRRPGDPDQIDLLNDTGVRLGEQPTDLDRGRDAPTSGDGGDDDPEPGASWGGRRPYADD
jgi:hypothetical protein